jgi:hypothetical protein
LHLVRAVEGDAELRRVLDEVQRRELDPLSAVREIMEKVFKVGDAGARLKSGSGEHEDRNRTHTR